jgi:hypothetical protein
MNTTNINFHIKSVTVIILFLATTAYIVDTWPPAKIKDYYSLNGIYFVRIVPTVIPEKYWDWRSASAKKRKKLSARDTLIIPCHAILYKRINECDSIVWKRNLINHVSPTTALVSNDGGYVVTFDNWYSAGYGADAMVYYNNVGDLIKRHMLEDISPIPINNFRRNISSMWWRCGEHFIDNYRIEICFIDNSKNIERRIYSLKDGKIEEKFTEN